MERLRLAGGEPLALDTVWLPDLGAPLLEADFTHAALYDELAARTGLRVDGGASISAGSRRPPPGNGARDSAVHRGAADQPAWFCRRPAGGMAPDPYPRGDRFSLLAESPPAPGTASPRMIAIRSPVCRPVSRSGRR